MPEPTPTDFVNEFLSKQWCQHGIRQPLCPKCLAGLLTSYGRSQTQPIEAKFAELLQLIDPKDPEIGSFLVKHGIDPEIVSGM